MERDKDSLPLDMNVFLPLVTFGTAELFLVLTRSTKLIALIKRPEQRSAFEQKEVARGLARSLFAEFTLFVPSSVALAVLILPPLIPYLGHVSSLDPALQISRYGLLGIVSYGFPFAALRAIVRHLALRTLAEFSTIAHKELE
jgi:hypothetical protein